MSSPGSSPPSEQSKSAHPAANRPRPAARQTRSDFYLEPNPFEESFKTPSNVRNSSPQRDSSGDSGKTVPDEPDRPQSRDNPRSSPHRSSSPARPVLPPLASISSPAEASYAWGYSNNSMNSLRSGPLSPAMLAGPQASPDPASSHLGFDPTTFRTGLTPRTGFTPRTGLTPGTGLTPLVGGFPPSPGTAASFFAILNGNAAAAPSAITPNTLNAISGVLNGTGPTSSFPNQTTSPSSQPQSDTSNYIPSATSAASSHANGLFLLSQAHQELTKREEAQARANGVAAVPPASTTAAPVATNGVAAAPANKRGTKRKSYDMTTPPPSAPARATCKRTRSNAKRSVSEEFDDDDDDDSNLDSGENEPSPPASLNNRRSGKKPETEEEKRRNFLERNRQGMSIYLHICYLSVLTVPQKSCSQVSATQKGLAGSTPSQSRVSLSRERKAHSGSYLFAG